jgi:hypothetical protein
MVTGNRGELGKVAIPSAMKKSIKSLARRERQVYKRYESLANKIIKRVGSKMKETGQVVIDKTTQDLANCFRCATVGSTKPKRLQTNTYIPSFAVPKEFAPDVQGSIPQRYRDLVTIQANGDALVQIYKASYLELAQDFVEAASKGIIYQLGMTKEGVATKKDPVQFKKRTLDGVKDNGLFAGTQAIIAKAAVVGCAETCLTARSGNAPLLKNSIKTSVNGECKPCEIFFKKPTVPQACCFTSEQDRAQAGSNDILVRTATNIEACRHLCCRFGCTSFDWEISKSKCHLSSTKIGGTGGGAARSVGEGTYIYQEKIPCQAKRSQDILTALTITPDAIQSLPGSTILTALTTPVTKGSTTLVVGNAFDFKIGQQVIIDVGTPVEELNTIAAFGSLILQSPLKFDHDAGASVTNNGEDILQATSCTCAGGIAAIGAACTYPNATICASCNAGWTLNGVVCQEKIVASSSSSAASGSSGSYAKIWQWFLLAALFFLCIGGTAGVVACMGGKKKSPKRASKNKVEEEEASTPVTVVEEVAPLVSPAPLVTSGTYTAMTPATFAMPAASYATVASNTAAYVTPAASYATVASNTAAYATPATTLYTGPSQYSSFANNPVQYTQYTTGPVQYSSSPSAVAPSPYVF